MERAKVRDGDCGCVFHHSARQGAKLSGLVAGELARCFESLARAPGVPCPRTHYLVRRWPSRSL